MAELTNKRKQQMRDYIKNRYHSDPKFRQYMINNAVTWQKNNHTHYLQTQREAYALMPQNLKNNRLAKIKLMRKKGLWKK